MTTLAHDEPELTWTQGSGREKRLFSLFSLNTEYEELPTLQRLINNPIMNTTRTLFVHDLMAHDLIHDNELRSRISRPFHQCVCPAVYVMVCPYLQWTVSRRSLGSAVKNCTVTSDKIGIHVCLGMDISYLLIRIGSSFVLLTKKRFCYAAVSLKIRLIQSVASTNMVDRTQGAADLSIASQK
jgi:hypothetical protein